MKSAALIVIGDEILTGKVQDKNSFTFAQKMFEQGVFVERITVIPDKIETIGEHCAEYSRCYDYVVTSGGVGPTHDDQTFAGVARGFSLPLKEHQEGLKHFSRCQELAQKGKTVSIAQKKMLLFPFPCDVIFKKPFWLPLVIVKNVYIFPGVPVLFEKMLDQVAYLFKGQKIFRQVIFTDHSESDIALGLQSMQQKYPAVAIGSYPQVPQKNYRVKVTVEGLDQETVTIVALKILPLIGGRTGELA